MKTVHFNYSVEQIQPGSFGVESKTPFLKRSSFATLRGSSLGGSKSSLFGSITRTLSTVSEKYRGSQECGEQEGVPSPHSSMDSFSTESSEGQTDEVTETKETKETKPPKSIFKGMHSSTVSHICLGIIIALCVSILGCDIYLWVTDTWASATSCVEYGIIHRRIHLTDSCISSLHLSNHTVSFASYARLKHVFCGDILDRTLECETFSKLETETYLFISAVSVEMVLTIIVTTMCFRVLYYIKTRKYLSGSDVQQSLKRLKFIGASMFTMSVLNAMRVLKWNMYTQPLIEQYELDRHGLPTGTVQSYTYYVEITSGVLCLCCLYLIRLVYLEIHPTKYITWLATHVSACDEEGAYPFLDHGYD